MSKELLAGAGLWFASFEITRDVSVPYLGVPLNILVAVGIGTYCAFAIAKDRIEPRRRMWAVAAACFFMGSAFTGIAQALIVTLTPLKMTDALQSGMGASVAFCTRFFLPWLADKITTGEWLHYIPFIRKKD